MPRKKTVADKAEILANFTAILRDENSKIADRIKAAENIVKYAEDAAKNAGAVQDKGVIITDDIPENTKDG